MLSLCVYLQVMAVLIGLPNPSNTFCLLNAGHGVVARVRIIIPLRILFLGEVSSFRGK